MAAIPIESLQVSEVVSPSTLYYLALYTLVIIIRFFKLKKQAGVWDSKKVFYVALEVVYTSSGLVVLLLEDLKAFAPFIIVAYLILVLVSSQIDSMEERFSGNAAFFTHLAVIAIVVSVTVVYFEVVQRGLETKRREEADKRAQLEKSKNYRIAIPYEDQTLRAHVGTRLFGSRQLVEIISVRADTEDNARAKALELFWEKVRPYREVEDFRSVIIVRPELMIFQAAR